MERKRSVSPAQTGNTPVLNGKEVIAVIEVEFF